MKYDFANSIAHPEKVVSDKVNYFADRFQFTLINLCRPGFDELENHKSLLEKIKTQIDHNDYGLSKKFIHHYMRNKLFEKNNFIVKNFYQKEFKELHGLWRKDHVSKDEGDTRISFAQFVDRLHTQLDSSLFQTCLNRVIDAFLCKLPLERHGHIELFDNCVPILVSELKFSGLSHKNLNRLFDNLFTKEVRISGKRVWTEAPLPPELLELKRNPENDPDEVFNAVQNYLHNMGLRNQFWGLYHIYKNSDLERTFLFKMKDIKTTTKIDLNYSGVRFSNRLKNEYVIEGVGRKNYIDFFDDEVVLAEAHVIANTSENGKQKAIRKIQEALYYFNAFFEVDARIDLGEYIIRDDDQNYRFKSISTALDTREIEMFDDGSLFKFFGSKRNKLIDTIIKLDKIYFQATCNPFPEERIILYWTYLEAFFKPNEKPENIRKGAALIASEDCLFDIRMDQFRVIYKVLYNMREKEMTDSPGVNRGNVEPTLSKAEINRYLKIQLEDFPFREVSSKINHPYLSKHLNWFNASTDEEKIKRAKEHIERMMCETYEQRNLLVHGGIHNEKAVMKITLVLPRIVGSFRRMVISKLKEEEFNTLPNVISSFLSTER